MVPSREGGGLGERGGIGGNTKMLKTISGAPITLIIR